MSNNNNDSEKDALYFSLRDEIVSNQNQESTILAFTYAAVLAILGVSFQEKVYMIAFI